MLFGDGEPMSDFLSNLAARNLDVMAEVVQPRLTSLFEPQATTGKFLNESSMALELPVESLAPDESTFAARRALRPRPMPRANPELPEISAPLRNENAGSAFTPLPRSTRRNIERTFDEQPPATEISVLSDQPQNLAVQFAPVRPRLPLLPRAEVAPPLAVETERHDTRAEKLTSFFSPATPLLAPSFNAEMALRQAAPAKLDHDEDTMKPKRDSAVQPTPPAISERVIVERHLTATEPQVSNRATRTIRPTAVVAQPYGKPVITDTTPSAVKPEPAPTIQVTIGRIEVRATPPSSSKRQPATVPVMSLDDYLRQRAGGGHP
jgi:hypothetical protein